MVLATSLKVTQHCNMKDIRLITASVVIIMAIMGFIVLVMSNHSQEAHDLINVMGLPALTFIIGLGSSLITNGKKD